LARTKNLVTGPGIASVVPSALPGTMLPEELAGGELPLPATSWKDQTPFVSPTISRVPRVILDSLDRSRRRATKADVQVIRGSGCNLMFVCMGCQIAVCVAAPRPTPALPTLRCSHILCIPTCDYTIHRSCCYDPYVRSFGS